MGENTAHMGRKSDSKDMSGISMLTGSCIAVATLTLMCEILFEKVLFFLFINTFVILHGVYCTVTRLNHT